MDEKKRRRAQGPQQQALLRGEEALRTEEPRTEEPRTEALRTEAPDTAHSARRRRRPQAAVSMEQPSAQAERPQRAGQRRRPDKHRAEEKPPRRKIKGGTTPRRMRFRGFRIKSLPLTWSRGIRIAVKGTLRMLDDLLKLLFWKIVLLLWAAIHALRFAGRIIADLLCTAAQGIGRLLARLLRAAGRTPQERLRSAVSLALAAVAVVSACMAGSIVIRTIRTKRLNEALSAQFSAYEGDAWTEETEGVSDALPTPEPVSSASPEQQDEPTAMDEPKPTEAPPIVKSTVFHQVGGDALPNMEALYDQNRDLVAWLNIPDVIDLPVVYRDNEYYLKRDFYKQANDAGTIFLDEHHPFRERTQNLLLHGHNMKDGTMFGRLTQYLTDSAYIKNHPFINFSTLWRQEQYVVFAVLDVSLDPASEDFFNYFSYSTFNSDEEFSFFARELQLRSEYAIPIDVQPSDALLMLSTCLDEDRLVIVARRVRTGETRSELRQMIHMAVRQ